MRVCVGLRVESQRCKCCSEQMKMKSSRQKIVLILFDWCIKPTHITASTRHSPSSINQSSKQLIISQAIINSHTIMSAARVLARVRPHRLHHHHHHLDQYHHHHQPTNTHARIQQRQLVVLGIESSFDDTSIGIVKDDGSILANHTISQRDHHIKFVLEGVD
jgi:hypothetical protein